MYGSGSRYGGDFYAYDDSFSIGVNTSGDTYGLYSLSGSGTARYFSSGTGYGLIVEKGNVGVGTVTPNHPLEMGSGAHVTSGGVWSNASSRKYKENIRDLTIEEAKEALDELRPTRFNYKADKEDECLGFIAEDVPELVTNKDRMGLSPMDIVAVLKKDVQKQQMKIEELESRLKEM